MCSGDVFASFLLRCLSACCCVKNWKYVNERWVRSLAKISCMSAGLEFDDHPNMYTFQWCYFNTFRAPREREEFVFMFLYFLFRPCACTHHQAHKVLTHSRTHILKQHFHFETQKKEFIIAALPSLKIQLIGDHGRGGWTSTWEFCGYNFRLNNEEDSAASKGSSRHNEKSSKNTSIHGEIVSIKTCKLPLITIRVNQAWTRIRREMNSNAQHLVR